MRSKNAKNIVLKNLLDACFGALCFFLVGYAFAFGGSDGNVFIGYSGFALNDIAATEWHLWLFQFTVRIRQLLLKPGVTHCPLCAAAVLCWQRAGHAQHCPHHRLVHSPACDFIKLQTAPDSPCQDCGSVQFAATAATIVSGAVAERCKFEGYLAYAMLLTSWVYPVVVHCAPRTSSLVLSSSVGVRICLSAVAACPSCAALRTCDHGLHGSLGIGLEWRCFAPALHAAGGWSSTGWASAFNSDPLFDVGVVDFAGSGVVHMTGGFSALAGAAIIGPRVGRFDADGRVRVATLLSVAICCQGELALLLVRWVYDALALRTCSVLCVYMPWPVQTLCLPTQCVAVSCPGAGCALMLACRTRMQTIMSPM